jgi:hypothetical protein
VEQRNCGAGDRHLSDKKTKQVARTVNQEMEKGKETSTPVSQKRPNGSSRSFFSTAREKDREREQHKKDG